MAQYRLSAQVIGRSAGRSAIAAAAYRAGEKLIDQRTGEVHDYSRKKGVVHSEILAPENAPAWMNDRQALWQAVEAVEKRRDAQLARELQLSLPHEMSDEQRANLVREFIAQNCVREGMVADIAIHRPTDHDLADQRNHHAHVMLTMRELLGDDGFGKKQRAWNEAQRLEQWRESWAQMQNQELERLGFEARVDHRSLEDQGVLREPQMHLGPIATEIERSGRNSHRGNENRAIQARNGVRQDLTHAGNVVDAKIAFEQRKLEVWGQRKIRQLEIDAQERNRRHEEYLTERMAQFEGSIDKEFGQLRDGLTREHQYYSDRLDVPWWRKWVRDITLTTRRDKQELASIEAQLQRVRADEAAKRQQEEQERETLKGNRKRFEEEKRAQLERGLDTAQKRREAEGWAMKPGKGVTDPAQEKATEQNSDFPSDADAHKRRLPPPPSPQQRRSVSRAGPSEERDRRFGLSDMTKRAQRRRTADELADKRAEKDKTVSRPDYERPAHEPDIDRIRDRARESLAREDGQEQDLGYDIDDDGPGSDAS